MPPFSTLKTFVKAVNSGDTNITRVLTKLMHYPEQWQENMGQITVSPLSQFLEDQFGAPGRMTPEEILHIANEWPMAQKVDLRAAVLLAIEVGRPMVFKWTLTSAQAPETDIVWPPSNTPLTVPVLVTFRSPRAGVTYSEEPESSAGYVVVNVPKLG
ncbi:MAG: hypothetical protein ABIP58_00925 [Dehalococcoidia bacterium]